MNVKKIIASLIILSTGLIAMLITSPASSLQNLQITVRVYLPHIENGVMKNFTPTRTPTRTITRTPTRAATQTPPRTPTKTNVPGPCNCTGPDLDCDDFSSHDAAQACFDHCRNLGFGDIFGLDGDSDGVACEALPAPGIE